jgi:hypothetical protein
MSSVTQIVADVCNTVFVFPFIVELLMGSVGCLIVTMDVIALS